MGRESPGSNIQNTALCGYTGIEEHRMAKLCLFAIYPQAYLANLTCVYMLFVPKGTGLMFIDLGLVVFWLCYSQDSVTTAVFSKDQCSTCFEAEGLV